MTETIYQAIYQDGEKTVTIEYTPLGEGCIEIFSVHMEPRQRSHFEIHEAERRKHRRGLVLDEQEQHAESMLPTSRLEQLKLFCP